MKNHFLFKYEKFMGREGIGLYLNDELLSFSYDVFEAFRMIAIALCSGDTIDYQLTDDFKKTLSTREVY